MLERGIKYKLEIEWRWVLFEGGVRDFKKSI